MALPSKKRPRKEKRKRRIAKKLKKINLSLCPKCKKSFKTHHLCPFCGSYANEEIVKIKTLQQKK